MLHLDRCRLRLGVGFVVRGEQVCDLRAISGGSGEVDVLYLRREVDDAATLLASSGDQGQQDTLCTTACLLTN